MALGQRIAFTELAKARSSMQRAEVERSYAIRYAVERGLSYRTIGRALGISHTTVYRIINGTEKK